MNILRFIGQSIRTGINAASLGYYYLFPNQIKASSGETKVALKDIIKAYNINYTSYYPVGSKQINSSIIKIDDATAETIANLITQSASSYSIDALWLAAELADESLFCPTAFDNNLGHDRLTPSFSTTDFGLAQVDGTYLPGKPGMPAYHGPEEPDVHASQAVLDTYTAAISAWENTMIQKAFDPSWAIPIMCLTLKGNLEEAQHYLSTDSVLASAVKQYNTTTFDDVTYFATLAYNKGFADNEVKQVGGRYYLKHGVVANLSYPVHINHYYEAFKKVLS